MIKRSRRKNSRRQSRRKQSRRKQSRRKQSRRRQSRRAMIRYDRFVGGPEEFTKKNKVSRRRRRLFRLGASGSSRRRARSPSPPSPLSRRVGRRVAREINRGASRLGTISRRGIHSLRDFARHSRDFARRSHGPVKRFVSRAARSGVKGATDAARATLRGVGRGLQKISKAGKRTGRFLEKAGEPRELRIVEHYQSQPFSLDDAPEPRRRQNASFYPPYLDQELLRREKQQWASETIRNIDDFFVRENIVFNPVTQKYEIKDGSYVNQDVIKKMINDFNIAWDIRLGY